MDQFLDVGEPVAGIDGDGAQQGGLQPGGHVGP
jgi:hypothetical protein